MNLKDLYDSESKELLITAFGNEVPASLSMDPVACAEKLASFVLDNHLGGVNIDWKDEHSFIAGTGEQWLVDFMEKLRAELPDKTIAHTAAPRFFSSSTYDGYAKVNSEVGHLIDFYNVQYFAKGKTYAELFTDSNGYSIQDLVSKGFDLNKLVIGKNIISTNPAGTVISSDLGSWTAQAYENLGWYAGVSYYQYSDDSDGSHISSATSSLMTIKVM